MPFPLIPTALGICFLLVWAFIGGMVFRDGQLTVRREGEPDSQFVPVASRRGRQRSAPHWQHEKRHRKTRLRAAS